MRLRLMATYLGVPYQAGLGPDGTEVTLFSPAPPPEELGFEAAGGHWRKQVDVTDLGALWQSRSVGDYRGEPCLVLDDLGDRLHIAYLGRDSARAAQLGYWEIDREVFEVVVPRPDVTGLAEERVEFPLSVATFPPSGTGPEQSGVAPWATVPAAGAATGPQPAVRMTGPQPAVGMTGPQPAAGDGVPGYGGAAVNGHGPGSGYHSSGPYGPRMPDRVAAWHGSPDAEPWGAPRAARERRRPGPWTEPWPERETGPEPWTEDEPWSDPWTEEEPGSEPDTAPPPGRRTRRKGRISPESVFAELLALADIPRTAYAVDEEVPGAMCLVQADGGFEVFSRTADARLELRFFEDEEAAYFYLFGMLAAEAIRSGRLGPTQPAGPTGPVSALGSSGSLGSGRINGHSNGSGPARTSSTSTETISNYLRG